MTKDKNYYEDLEAYYESKKISKELLDSLKSESVKGGEELENYFIVNPYASNLKTTLTDELLLENEVKRFKAARESMSANKARLLQDISFRDKRKSKRKLFVRFSLTGVAAAILFFTIQVLAPDDKFVMLDNEHEQMTVSKPTLILSSGRHITLDESERLIKVDNYSHLLDGNDTDTKQKVQEEQVLDNTLIIPSKYTYNVVLADGSNVTMNAGGKMVYPVSFKGDKREIKLEGEAYFNIVKDSRPFVVNINQVKITVYGTQFNVKGFKDGGVETVLVEGSVGLRFDGGEEFKIEPNQLAVISKEGTELVYKVDVQNYLGWIKNSFCYHNTHLTKVFEDIENWYGVEINADMITENECIDLLVDRTLPIERILLIIEETTNYKIINEGGGKYKIDKK